MSGWNIRFVLKTTLLLAIAATTADAQVTIYPTRSTFDTLNPNTTLITFEGLASGTNCPESLTSSSATFLAINRASAESFGTGVGLIGFSSASQPITEVDFQITGAIGTPEPLIDNVAFSVVPEPSPILLILSAAGLLLALQRVRAGSRD